MKTLEELQKENEELRKVKSVLTKYFKLKEEKKYIKEDYEQ